MRDRIYRNRCEEVEPFRFRSAVASVFDDMAVRSIPHYAEVQRMTVSLVERFYRHGTSIYDLGCATGNTVVALLEMLPGPVQIYAVDNSPAMINQARSKIKGSSKGNNACLKCGDIRDIAFSNPSIVIAHYTLHFLPLPDRATLVSRIYTGLVPGGIMIFSEKVVEDSNVFTKCFSEEYYSFKIANGYNATEIEQKAKALNGVLVPLSINQNLSLLHDAGFQATSIFFKWQNFASFIAMKSS